MDEVQLVCHSISISVNISSKVYVILKYNRLVRNMSLHS